IQGLARRMLGNEADAEDVAQEVLLVVVRKLNTFRGDSSFATWIHRVTTNAALLHHRKKALRKERTMAPEFCTTGTAHLSPVRREPAAPDEQAQSREDRQGRARFRRQALDWLRAELEARRRLLEQEPGNTGWLAVGYMQRWLDDADFAGVRGPD